MIEKVIARAKTAIDEFLQMEALGGIALAAAAALAIAMCNLGFVETYNEFLTTKFPVQIGAWSKEKTMLVWINDALMAVFFFLVGLEIKREVMAGELSDPRKLAFPVFGAIGGMVAPILIFLSVALLTGASAQAKAGWPIPVATDIAFALAVLSFAGPRAPVSLKVFLLTLAVVDDLLAISLIALLFTKGLNVVALGFAGALLAGLFGLNRLGVKARFPYLLTGVVIWALVLEAGIHPTIAGVAVAFTVPMTGKTAGQYSPLEKLEHDLHPIVAFAILPLFAFANAGFSFGDLEGAGGLAAPVTLGIAAGLLLGKPIGILAFGALAQALKWGTKPAGASWTHMLGVSFIAGIGFTVSLFIGSLAFEDAGAGYDAQVRLGVLAGSILAGALGLLTLARATAPHEADATAARGEAAS